VEVSDALPKLADAIVVGGGIVGAAVARQLAKDGVDTVLLEDRAFGGAVSGASLACLGTHMHNLDELAVLVEACGLWRDIAEELGNPFEYNRSGQLRFILHPEDVVVAQRWIDGERAFGLPPELLTPEEVREVEPLLTGPIHAASWSPGDATVNPFLAVRAFVADGRSAGVRALANTGVKALLTDGDKVTGVETARGRIAAGHTILAAGPWSANLSEGIGLKLPIVPRQAQCLASTRQPRSIRTVVGACERAGGVESGYTQIQQAASGQVLFNTVTAAPVNRPGDEDRINEVPLGFVRDSIRMLTTLFPSLRDISMLRSWVRFEAVTPDDRFLAGRLPREGLLIASGDNGTGFCRSPFLAKLVSRIVRGVEADPSDTLYAPSRFAGLKA
jgi:glycine/D-amino acid oxidase-like deaminating enzyme